MIVLLLMACDAPAPVADGDALPFPHPAGFRDAHGEATLQHGDGCASCHRDGDGAPACADCHEGYPHVSGWLSGASHGAAEQTGCLSCHGADTAVASPACTSCHGSYPHPEGWAAVGQHGAWALARGSAAASCGGCHDSPSVSGAPACASCHADYPHGDGWADSHQAAKTDTCTGCHGLTGEGGASGVSCARCHPGYPHEDGWLTSHISAATLRGEATCMSCHAPGEAPPDMPASCGASCHGGTK